MEENNKKRQLQRAVFVFTLVVCLSAIAGGLGSATFSNYFKEVYMWTVPREGSWKYRENRRGFCVH